MNDKTTAFGKIARFGAVASLAVAGLVAAGTAQARDNVSFSLGIGVPGVAVGVSNYYPAYQQPYYAPVYQQPAPVYYAPAPVYVRPAPVYYAPPVYYRPAPRYYGPRGYGHGGHGRGHGGHGHR